jgi:glycosyltransferase involved in cell wall biosynthesis
MLVSVSPAPLVSVGIPTWNRSGNVRRCIESVLAQDVQAFDIHVFDNASTDDTESVVRSFGDDRVHYHRNPENVGARRNQTMALHAGEAPFVTVLHDDSVLLPRSLRNRVAFLERHPDVGLVHTAMRRVDDSGATLRESERWTGDLIDEVETGRTFLERSLKLKCRVWTPTVLFRREVAAGQAFLDSDVADDAGLWLRLSFITNVGYLEEPSATFTVNVGASTADGLRTIESDEYRPTLSNIAAIARLYRRRYPEILNYLGPARGLRAIAVGELSTALGVAIRNGYELPGLLPRERLHALIAGARVAPLSLVHPSSVRAAMHRR